MATAPQTCEAYVIENDGTRRPLNVEFVGTPATGARRAATAADSAGQGGIPRSVYVGTGAAAVGAAAAAAAAANRTRAQTQAPGTAAAPRPRSLHLVRRLLGGALMLVGIPMLVLPGPGVLLLALGLILLLKP